MRLRVMVTLFVTATALFSFPVVASAGYYVVLAANSSDVVISDGSSTYLIDYGFECSSFDFSEGKTIYIDSLYPSFADKIIVDGLIDTKSCSISSAEDLNLKSYSVTDVVDSDDKIIVQDRFGTNYLVEYGTGCLSMWRYEGKKIDIDIGGSFLDGIGDRIYLFNSDDDCKVWDAEELNLTGASSYTGSYTSTYTQTQAATLTCPANSQLVGSECKCPAGTLWNGTTCRNATQNCQDKYGQYSYGDEKNCYCSTGYQFNSDSTACIAAATETTDTITCGGKTWVKKMMCNPGYKARCSSNGSIACDPIPPTVDMPVINEAPTVAENVKVVANAPTVTKVETSEVEKKGSRENEISILTTPIETDFQEEATSSVDVSSSTTPLLKVGFFSRLWRKIAGWFE